MVIHNMEYITPPEYCNWNDLNEGDESTCSEWNEDTMEIYFQS